MTLKSKKSKTKCLVSRPKLQRKSLERKLQRRFRLARQKEVLPRRLIRPLTSYNLLIRRMILP